MPPSLYYKRAVMSETRGPDSALTWRAMVIYSTSQVIQVIETNLMAASHWRMEVRR